MNMIEAYEDRVRYLEERYLDAVTKMGLRPTDRQRAREAQAWNELQDARAQLQRAKENRP